MLGRTNRRGPQCRQRASGADPGPQCLAPRRWVQALPAGLGPRDTASAAWARSLGAPRPDPGRDRAYPESFFSPRAAWQVTAQKRTLPFEAKDGLLFSPQERATASTTVLVPGIFRTGSGRQGGVEVHPTSPNLAALRHDLKLP